MKSLVVWLRGEKGPGCAVSTIPPLSLKTRASPGSRGRWKTEWSWPTLVHGALVLVVHPRKKEGEEAEWGKDRDNWKTDNQTGLVNKTSPNSLHTFADKDTGQAQPDRKHFLHLRRTCSVSVRS